MVRMAEYCSKYGKPAERPYFSIDGHTHVTAEAWDSLRSPWNHRNGITNVWTRPPLADSERVKGTMKKSAPRSGRPSKLSVAHLNQKPLEFMKRQIFATTNEGDLVWEPFGGLISASIAAFQLHRRFCAAEINPDFYQLGKERLQEAQLYSKTLFED